MWVLFQLIELLFYGSFLLSFLHKYCVFKLDFLNGKVSSGCCQKMYGVDEALGNQKAILF